jgi:2'-5' RNA ligase
MTTFRGFIAIEIQPASSIIEFENSITKSGADVKLVEPQNIHLTLKFLGDTEESKIEAIDHSIKESLAGIKPFSLTLIGTGVFPNEKYVKVIWIGIKDGDMLKTIAGALDEKLVTLGFPKEKRDFSPHLTIGRVKTARNKEQLLAVIKNHDTKKFLQQEIHSVTLKKSDLTTAGPIYTTLREIHL